MSAIINTNVASIIAQNALTVSSNNYDQSLERLSSGYRINSASDDATGLSISEGLTGEINDSQQALGNVQDASNVLQTAEGGISTISDNLQRIRELAVQAANDTNGPSERDAITTEIQSLLTEDDRLTNATTFNGISLLNGTATNAVVQAGPDSDPNSNVIDVSSALQNTSSASLGIVGTSATFPDIASVNLDSAATAQSFLNDVDTALNNLNTQRSSIGAFQNRLQSASDNLTNTVDNLTAANSQIRDVDVASESSNLTQEQILTQSAATMLSQSNTIPEMILNILTQRQ